MEPYQMTHLILAQELFRRSTEMSLRIKLRLQLCNLDFKGLSATTTISQLADAMLRC